MKDEAANEKRTVKQATKPLSQSKAKKKDVTDKDATERSSTPSDGKTKPHKKKATKSAGKEEVAKAKKADRKSSETAEQKADSSAQLSPKKKVAKKKSASTAKSKSKAAPSTLADHSSPDEKKTKKLQKSTKTSKHIISSSTASEGRDAKSNMNIDVSESKTIEPNTAAPTVQLNEIQPPHVSRALESPGIPSKKSAVKSNASPVQRNARQPSEDLNHISPRVPQHPAKDIATTFIMAPKRATPRTTRIHQPFHIPSPYLVNATLADLRYMRGAPTGLRTGLPSGL